MQIFCIKKSFSDNNLTNKFENMVQVCLEDGGFLGMLFEIFCHCRFEM